MASSWSGASPTLCTAGSRSGRSRTCTQPARSRLVDCRVAPRAHVLFPTNSRQQAAHTFSPTHLVVDDGAAQAAPRPCPRAPRPLWASSVTTQQRCGRGHILPDPILSSSATIHGPRCGRRRLPRPTRQQCGCAHIFPDPISTTPRLRPIAPSPCQPPPHLDVVGDDAHVALGSANELLDPFSLPLTTPRPRRGCARILPHPITLWLTHQPPPRLISALVPSATQRSPCQRHLRLASLTRWQRLRLVSASRHCHARPLGHASASRRLHARRVGDIYASLPRPISNTSASRRSLARPFDVAFKARHRLATPSPCVVSSPAH